MIKLKTFSIIVFLLTGFFISCLVHLSKFIINKFKRVVLVILYKLRIPALLNSLKIPVIYLKLKLLIKDSSKKIIPNFIKRTIKQMKTK